MIDELKQRLGGGWLDYLLLLLGVLITLYQGWSMIWIATFVLVVACVLLPSLVELVPAIASLFGVLVVAMVLSGRSSHLDQALVIECVLLLVFVVDRSWLSKVKKHD